MVAERGRFELPIRILDDHRSGELTYEGSYIRTVGPVLSA